MTKKEYYENKDEVLEKLNLSVFEDYFYDPDCLTSEDVAEFRNDQNHDVYAWTMQDQNSMIEELPLDFSEQDVITYLRGAGYAI